MNIKTLLDVQRDPQPQPALWRRPRVRIVTIFAVLFAGGIAIRLWRLGVLPAWQWDEAVYWQVSTNVQHGVLAEHSVYGLPWEPFLYQPPIYFNIGASWFDVVGSSIYHARVFGVWCTAVMQILLFGLLWRLTGPRVALLTALPVLFDGWLLYIERVSYIENALMILVVLGLLLYKWAIDEPSWWRFLLAGLAVGAAASFKQTGAYVVVVVLLHWLIVRREHRRHLILLGAAVAVIAAYLWFMVHTYDVPGHPWFIDQSTVQIRRVLGLQKSGGTLNSLGSVLHLLTQQYKFFIPSLLLGSWGIVIAVCRTWRCYRARSWERAQPNALLYSWLVTGVVVFGLSSLKFPQYFVLILLPAYCYLWTEVASWDIRALWRTLWPIAAAVIGVCSFALTTPVFNVNSLAEVQAYAAKNIPASAIVVTEQSIGDLISQRWCTVEKSAACVGHASYAITWQTYLQSSFDQGDAPFYKIMQGATDITSLSGTVGTATVWKLRAG